MTQQQQSYNDDQERRRTELHERIAKKRMENDQVSLTHIKGLFYSYSRYLYASIRSLYIVFETRNEGDKEMWSPCAGPRPRLWKVPDKSLSLSLSLSLSRARSLSRSLALSLSLSLSLALARARARALSLSNTHTHTQKFEEQYQNLKATFEELVQV
jgi:hypothetical protein